MIGYKKTLGGRGEEIAREYMISLGFEITGQNVRVSHDEIDIIAENEDSIVFVEVKSRAATGLNRRYGSPAGAVDHTKKERLLRSAGEYMRRNAVTKRPRIDVIEVVFPPVHKDTPIDLAALVPLEVKHFKNAVIKGRT